MIAQGNLRMLVVLFAMALYGVPGNSMAVQSGNSLSLQPGHLKPFGCCGVKHGVKEVEGFPSIQAFYENHVLPQMPVKMKGAARLSPAFHKWTDEYFVEKVGKTIVGIELQKKEHRIMQKRRLTMTEYINMYKTNNVYMVSDLPMVLRKDVTVPCPIQCKAVMQDRFVQLTMWHSNGGTKGSFHVDTVENINCVFRGNKTFTMIEYDKYKDEIDYGEDPYLDVDSVDFLKFPWMADVELHQVNLTEGDCLYIPFSWFHQVNSFGTNIGISTQWRYNKEHDRKTYTKCTDTCDETFTSDTIKWMGYKKLDEKPEMVRSGLLGMFVKKKAFDREATSKYFYGPEMRQMMGVPRMREYVEWFMTMVDHDKDGIFTKDEVDFLDDEKLIVIGKELNKLTDDTEAIQKIIWGFTTGKFNNDEL